MQMGIDFSYHYKNLQVNFSTKISALPGHSVSQLETVSFTNAPLPRHSIPVRSMGSCIHSSAPLHSMVSTVSLPPVSSMALHAPHCCDSGILLLLKQYTSPYLGIFSRTPFPLLSTLHDGTHLHWPLLRSLSSGTYKMTHRVVPQEVSITHIASGLSFLPPCDVLSLSFHTYP